MLDYLILTPALYPHQPMEVSVDETKLTLHGLQQYYVKLKDAEKNRKLFQILDDLEFNQVSNLGIFHSSRSLESLSTIIISCLLSAKVFGNWLAVLYANYLVESNCQMLY